MRTKTKLPKCKIRPLPCPFCGSKSKSSFNPHDLDRDGAEDPYFVVECPNKSCGVFPMTFGSTLLEAVVIWNHRTPVIHNSAFFKALKEDAIRVQNFDLAAALRTVQILCS